MLAEILTIGDELCRGEIVDTNSAWLAGELWNLGVTVGWMTSCRDDAADMRRAFTDAAGRADLVLCSGGLGPTEDDLTVDVVSELAGVAPEVHQASLERMQARFAKANFTVTPNNIRQVRAPAGAQVLLNPAGLAPGFAVELAAGGRRTPLICFPGVPRELKAIWEQHTAAHVASLAAVAERIARRTYRVFGIGESQIDHRLSGITSGHAGASVHYQVAFPETLVKLVVRDADSAAAETRLAAMDAELRARLGRLVYSWTGPGGWDNDSMAAALGRRLVARQATLAVAESCTGGMLGSLVTDIAGSSAWFKGGWITYANDMKSRELGVPAEIIAAHGAVSQPCVEAMARGALDRAGATVAAAISGIAGPDGGTPDKPVGTVHVAVAGPQGALCHKQYTFPGARDQVRRLAAYWAMRMIQDAVGDGLA